jgi:hypothetical protein
LPVAAAAWADRYHGRGQAGAVGDEELEVVVAEVVDVDDGFGVVVVSGTGG